jgi:hypothetical protein
MTKEKTTKPWKLEEEKSLLKILRKSKRFRPLKYSH